MGRQGGREIWGEDRVGEQGREGGERGEDWRVGRGEGGGVEWLNQLSSTD